MLGFVAVFFSCDGGGGGVFFGDGGDGGGGGEEEDGGGEGKEGGEVHFGWWLVWCLWFVVCGCVVFVMGWDL